MMDSDAHDNPPPPPPAAAPIHPPPPPAFLPDSNIPVEEIRDIYPTTVLTTGSVKLLNRDTFTHHVLQAIPFVLFKHFNQKRVLYHVGPHHPHHLRDRVGPVPLHALMDDANQQRLRRLLKDSEKMNDVTGTVNPSWALLDMNYKKWPLYYRKDQTRVVRGQTSCPASTAHTSSSHTATVPPKRKREEHGEIRLGFCFGNMFAVKAKFTFGERKTEPGEYHLIQTSEVPLLYNQVHPHKHNEFLKEWNQTPNFREGQFDPSQQKFFTTYILHPHQLYRIPQNTIYILLSVQKTLFALDRVTYDTYETMAKTDPHWSNVVPLAANLKENEIPQNTTSFSTEPSCSSSPGPSSSKKRCTALTNQWTYHDQITPSEIPTDNTIYFQNVPHLQPNTTTYFLMQSPVSHPVSTLASMPSLHIQEEEVQGEEEQRPQHFAMFSLGEEFPCFSSSAEVSILPDLQIDEDRLYSSDNDNNINTTTFRQEIEKIENSLENE